MCFFFFFNDTATPEIYTLSLHDALPISPRGAAGSWQGDRGVPGGGSRGGVSGFPPVHGPRPLLRPHGDRRSPARGGPAPPRPHGILEMVRRGGSAVQGGVVTGPRSRGGHR